MECSFKAGQLSLMEILYIHHCQLTSFEVAHLRKVWWMKDLSEWFVNRLRAF